MDMEAIAHPVRAGRFDTARTFFTIASSSQIEEQHFRIRGRHEVQVGLRR